MAAATRVEHALDHVRILETASTTRCAWSSVIELKSGRLTTCSNCSVAIGKCSGAEPEGVAPDRVHVQRDEVHAGADSLLGHRRDEAVSVDGRSGADPQDEQVPGVGVAGGWSRRELDG